MPVPNYFAPRSKRVTLSSLTGGMTNDEIQDEIDRGARFVVFQYTISAVFITFRRHSPILFLRAGENAAVKSLPYTLTTLLLGWWGIPFGLIFTPMAIFRNLSGGKDLTGTILSRIAASRAPQPDMLSLFPEPATKV